MIEREGCLLKYPIKIDKILGLTAAKYRQDFIRANVFEAVYPKRAFELYFPEVDGDIFNNVDF